MKSILYVGATLMIGASIYGFADYKKASHDKKFTGMYETKQPVPAKQYAAPAIEEVKPLTVEKKQLAVKAEPVKLGGSKTTIEVDAAEKIEKEPSTTTALAENKSVTKYKKAKKRKLDTKLFSRAPLREEIEVAGIPAPKKETKKAAAKEY